MHLIVIESVPGPDAEGPDDTNGAYVQCWVDFPIQDGAEILARHYIKQAGWLPGESIETVRWVERSELEDDAEDLGYFLEAAEAGITLVFHSWPENGEDEDSEPPADTP